ncbi:MULTISPECIES: DUF2971 domain-containing protein [Sanguibacteroides]|nr:MULTISPECIES: DUF2971 domain-containing protein [Sanguibacteroides]
MNRAEFSNILSSIIIPGDTSIASLPVLLAPINKAITELKPDKLFRYRTVNENNINSLKSDDVYTVTADMFNDPYDSLFQYDINQIESLIRNTANVEFVRIMQDMFQKTDSFISEINRYFPNGEFNVVKENLCKTDLSNSKEINNRLGNMAFGIIALINAIAPLVETQIRNAVTYACFSERVDSITMWSHYTNYHEGYALGYSKDELSFKQMNMLKCGLFPVIYSESRYNGSSLFAWAIYNVFGWQIIEPDKLATIKVGLNKSTDWSYENEWRLICTAPQQERSSPKVTPITIHPSEIYYGTRISKENKALLHSIAVDRNLAEFDMSIDNASDHYQMIVKPAVFQ